MSQEAAKLRCESKSFSFVFAVFLLSSFRMCDNHHMCAWALAIYRTVEGLTPDDDAHSYASVMSTFFMRKSISFIGLQTSHLGRKKIMTICAVKWRKYRRGGAALAQIIVLWAVNTTTWATQENKNETANKCRS